MCQSSLNLKCINFPSVVEIFGISLMVAQTEPGRGWGWEARRTLDDTKRCVTRATEM
jgi:hypothetical protein